MYTPDKLEDLVEAVNTWKKEQAPEESVFFTVALGPHDGKVGSFLRMP